MSYSKVFSSTSMKGNQMTINKFYPTTNMSAEMKKQRGVTLMELIAGLAVMSVIVVGAVSLYSSATSSEQSTSLQRDIGAIQAATRQIFNGQGNYGAVRLNDVLNTANKVPSTLAVSGTGATMVYKTRSNGDVTVTGATSTFTVGITNVTPDLCIPLLTNAAGWSKIQVTGGTAQTTFPVSPATAQTECTKGTVITFTN